MRQSILTPPAFVDWPCTRVYTSVQERFEEMAATHPERLAVKSGDETLTYAQLNRAANRLAHAILERCRESPEAAGLLLEQGAGMIVAILAVLKAGKFYVPLDPNGPPARLAGTLADARARLLVSNRANLATARSLGAAEWVINLDELGPDCNEQNPPVAASPDAYFNIVYTSGSTGQPKGVVQTHANVLHNARLRTRELKVTREDRFTLLTPYTFGASAGGIFNALLNGAALFPFDLKRTGLGKLADWLNQEQITIYHSVPTVYRQFLGLAGADARLPHIRAVQLGGEAVVKHDVELFRHHFSSHCYLINGLGSTETYTATLYLFSAQDELKGPVVPIGYAVEDTEILVLDENRKPVPPGTVGEIAIRSEYLSPGYWQQPELTAAAFSDDPEGGRQRTYLTGDLGRMQADGCLEYVGRKDATMKVRGYRVEAAEVEVALLELDSVRDAAVEIQAGPDGEGRLIAYLLPQGKASLTPGELRNLLAEKLPEYMIPSLFVTMEEFPLLPFGKVNRRALPKPDWARPVRSAAYAPPSNATQAALCQIYARILRLKADEGEQRIGIHDHFFDLGGDSLRASELVVQVRDTFGVDLALTAVYEKGTVMALAGAIEEARGRSTSRQPEPGQLDLQRALRMLEDF